MSETIMSEAMHYKARHRTVYDYTDPVTLAHHMIHLSPRSLPHQKVRGHSITIDPVPDTMSERLDPYGNALRQFSIETSHRRLVIESLVEIELTVKAPLAADTAPAWESVRDLIRAARPDTVKPFAYLRDSTLIEIGDDLAAYAATDFTPDRPLVEALLAFMGRLHSEFTFDPQATTVTTPVREVLDKKRGVCQDFAQVMIGALRSLGLPACYVSGYLRTRPPPGRMRLVGADQSHAWVAVWLGGDWIELDPTNDCVPGGDHITIGYGRDYDDVAPVRGIIVGGGPHRLQVGVDVMPIEPASDQDEHRR